MIQILKYPYPYKAWLTISNDPDNTTLEAWKELDEFIFHELELDWANTAFVYNYNLNLPDQVSLASHAEIAKQPIDAIHTWGDFVHGGKRGFCREDAAMALKLLEQLQIQPKIWVDHSRFTGNLLHNHSWGSIPTNSDSSGNTYPVHEYSLDLIREAGIAYIWDGKLTHFCGQDRKLTLEDHLRLYSVKGKIRFLIFNLYKFILPLFKNVRDENKQLEKYNFPDGSALYTFKRFGEWKYADILGLSDVISQQNIKRLISKQGTMVAYTHLGKRNPKYKGADHIPEETKQCMRFIKQKVEAKELLFSSLSKLLDYLVIRDNIQIKGNTISFKPDGIRFKQVSVKDLYKHTFSFKFKDIQHPPTIIIDGSEIKDARITAHGNSLFTLNFSK